MCYARPCHVRTIGVPYPVWKGGLQTACHEMVWTCVYQDAYGLWEPVEHGKPGGSPQKRLGVYAGHSGMVD